MADPKDVAIMLMRMALALLDEVGEPDASTRLQHAIDIATRLREDGETDAAASDASSTK